MEAEKYYKQKFESLDESVKGLPIIKKAAICNLAEYDEDIVFSGVNGNDYVFAFTNHGELKGLHRVESYNESYLLLNKKNVYSHIHYQMEYYGVSRCDDRLDVNFLCATEVLKDGETPSDYITCSFNFRGEKIFKTVTMENGNVDEIDYDLVEQYVDIAAKTAECAKLTKAERKMCGDGIGDALKSLFN